MKKLPKIWKKLPKYEKVTEKCKKSSRKYDKVTKKFDQISILKMLDEISSFGFDPKRNASDQDNSKRNLGRKKIDKNLFENQNWLN